MAKRKLRICGIFHIEKIEGLSKKEVRNYISYLVQNDYPFIGLERTNSIFSPYEECNLLKFLTPHDKVEMKISCFVITRFII